MKIKQCECHRNGRREVTTPHDHNDDANVTPDPFDGGCPADTITAHSPGAPGDSSPPGAFVSSDAIAGARRNVDRLIACGLRDAALGAVQSLGVLRLITSDEWAELDARIVSARK